MLVLHKIGKFTMSLLPNKNLFIVTSALHANIGVVSEQERMLQTIETLENLKKKVPDAMVLFVDGSPHNIDDDKKKMIRQYCQSIWFNTNPDVYAMASSGRKSVAEIIMLFNTLLKIKQSKSNQNKTTPNKSNQSTKTKPNHKNANQFKANQTKQYRKWETDRKSVV